MASPDTVTLKGLKDTKGARRGREGKGKEKKRARCFVRQQMTLREWQAVIRLPKRRLKRLEWGAVFNAFDLEMIEHVF